MNLTYLHVPHELSDEAAAQLSEMFNDLAFSFDGHYFSQITRYKASLRYASGTYYDERRDNERPCRHRQLDLFDDHDDDIEL